MTAHSIPGGFNEVHATGFINASAGAGATLQKPKGISSMARGGVGDYSITLQDGIASTECEVTFTINAAVGCMPSVVHTSNTVKQLLFDDAAAMPVDADFRVTIRRLWP